jgi:hypothetical protein
VRLLRRDLLEVSRPLFCCERGTNPFFPCVARLFRVAGVAGHRGFVFLLVVRGRQCGFLPLPFMLRGWLMYVQRNQNTGAGPRCGLLQQFPRSWSPSAWRKDCGGLAGVMDDGGGIAGCVIILCTGVFPAKCRGVLCNFIIQFPLSQKKPQGCTV